MRYFIILFIALLAGCTVRIEETENERRIVVGETQPTRKPNLPGKVYDEDGNIHIDRWKPSKPYEEMNFMEFAEAADEINGDLVEVNEGILYCARRLEICMRAAKTVINTYDNREKIPFDERMEIYDEQIRRIKNNHILARD